jgi:glycosyltransferase involved in cell wall biosynthesis
MCDNPLVSVVIPIRNSMPYVLDTINSVIIQSYKNLEIILCDNDSEDGLTEALKNYSDHRLKYFKVAGIISPGANWTFATKLANGEFVKLLCSDDLLTRQAIEKQVQILLNHPEIAMVASKRNIINSQGKKLILNYGLGSLNNLVIGNEALRTSFLKGTNIIGEPGAVLFRHEDLSINLPWRDDRVLMLDFSMYCKLLPNSKLYALNSVGLNFRVHSKSISSHNLRLHTDQFMAEFFALRDLYPEKFNFTKKEIIQMYKWASLKNFLKKLIFKYRLVQFTLLVFTTLLMKLKSYEE